ncbi:MAG: hypothetical protein WKG07_30470 [Hymenobacter sp.]
MSLTDNFIMSFDLEALIRPNIRAMKPYSSARDEFTGEAQVMLDANENSLGNAGARGSTATPTRCSGP